MTAIRHLLILVAALSSLAALAQDAPQRSQYELGVDGLACPFCAYGIEKRLSRIDGVAGIETDVAGGRVTVTLEEGASLTAAHARRAVDEAGFTLRSFEQSSPDDPR